MPLQNEWYCIGFKCAVFHIEWWAETARAFVLGYKKSVYTK